MTGNELLDKMELVDYKYIEAADSVHTHKRRRKNIAMWATLAACAVLVIALAVQLSKTGPIIPFETAKSTTSEEACLAFDAESLEEAAVEEESSVIISDEPQTIEVSIRKVTEDSFIGTVHSSNLDSFIVGDDIQVICQYGAKLMSADGTEYTFEDSHLSSMGYKTGDVIKVTFDEYEFSGGINNTNLVYASAVEACE